jgi:putative transposase
VDRALWAAITTAFAQPDPAATRRQLRAVADTLRASHPPVINLLEEAGTDLCAYSSFPRAHWTKIWSTNPLERLHREIKRRCDVVGIFPDDTSVIRLVGAVLGDQHDEWQVTDRRYLSEASMALIDTTDQNDPTKEVTTTNQPALPAAS